MSICTVATVPGAPGLGGSFVGREPCDRSCAPEGIFDGMNAAGLDKLIVHHPKDCMLYEKGGNPMGVPCSASTTCANSP